MKEKEIIFDWSIVGTNCDQPIKKVYVFGHTAKIYKAFDNNLWSCIIDFKGKRGFHTEKAAIDYAESTIKAKIRNRIDKSMYDLTMLTI